MANKSTNSDPQDFPTVTPHLICNGANDAIDFYKKAFGAEELMRLPGPDGRLMHGCIRIGTSPVMLADVFPDCPGSVDPKTLSGNAIVVHLNVPDVDAFMNRAEKAGATVVMPATDMFWGDRYGQLDDPFGHRWSVATTIKKLTPEEIQAAMLEAMPSA